MMNQVDALRRLSAATSLAADFASLTATGGRLVGSESEAAARRWLEQRLRKIPGIRLDNYRFPYRSWACTQASFELIGDGGITRHTCHPLYWSGETPVDGLEAGLVDLGRGTEDDFRARADAIRGRIVIVRHEYPFARETIHRRVKYNWSRENGAVGFIIINNNPGNSLVTGSCGQDSADNIPAIGVSQETGAILSAATQSRARLRIVTTRRSATGVNLLAEVPGQTPEWVIICAHYDGHDLAESALDNATGVVVTIAIFESFRPFLSKLRRGLRLALFTAEESGLLGSKLYVQSLTTNERDKVAAVINLDTLAGSEKLSCLTSGFDELQTFVAETSKAAGIDFSCFLPLLRNSDHFNFAAAGIPAIRLIAGFDDPQAGARLLLTSADRHDVVSIEELARNTTAAGALVWSGLNWPGSIAKHKPTAALP